MKKSSLLLFLLFIFAFSLSAQDAGLVEQKDTVNSFDQEPIVYLKTGNGDLALVFVHGWSCDKSYWTGQLEYFGNNYSVYAIDLTGHGESGLGRVDWTIKNYGKDVKAVIETENLDKIILIGHSMGGAVILSAALQIGDKVKALIGIDTYHEIELKYSEAEINEFCSPIEKDFINTTKQFVKGMFFENADSNIVEMISSDMSSAPPVVALASLRDFLKFDKAVNFDKLNVPIRLINSDIYPTNTEAAMRHIKDFDLKIINGVGHFLMLEKPDEFNKSLEEIINELEY